MPFPLQQLFEKYDVPVPRYTSYPTVPGWDIASFTVEQWRKEVARTFRETNASHGISVYIHLPFCESLCTYCACTTRITKNHKVEIPYIQSLLKEWELYKTVFGGKPIIRELHLGGGTPTFFSPENLHWLISYLLEDAIIHEQHEFSFEGHPNNTTREHLQVLNKANFTRVSFGVQDLDPKVQETIHRIQPFENLRRVTEEARSAGFESISYDLIYGLPFQTTFSVSDTIEKVLTLKPDRISFYSYAHVPWLKPGQRGYETADLPRGSVKRQLYETGRQLLKAAGYADIGMDHFALPHDSLYEAQVNGKLHRNFMGYTTTQTRLLIGLGSSAISDARGAYAQNIRTVEEYRSAIQEGKLAIFKGHQLTDDDLLIRRCIQSISCQGRLSRELLNQAITEDIRETLVEMEEEGILRFTDDGFEVTTEGWPFIRNVCAVFDRYLKNQNSGRTVFSKAL